MCLTAFLRLLNFNSSESEYLLIFHKYVMKERKENTLEKKQRMIMWMEEELIKRDEQDTGGGEGERAGQN